MFGLGCSRVVDHAEARVPGIAHTPAMGVRSILAFALAGCLLALPLPAATEDYTDLFVFGDSLSDTGNGCTALAVAGYKPGRCSNGEVWSEQLADLLGLEARASLQGGTNFAFGGDETSDLDLQISVFALSVFFQADPDALYVVWLGGNDILGIPGSPTATQDAVDNIVDGIRDLQGMGAEHFLVVNLPDIGRAYGDFILPASSGSMFTPAERDAVTALSLDFNDRLATALATEPITTLFELDIETLVEEVFADPAGFGIVSAAIDTTSDDTDFGIPCLIDPVCVFDPQGSTADGFFLFDAIHPTTAMHAVIADRAFVLLPEPGMATGLAAGVLMLVGLARRDRFGTRGSRRASELQRLRRPWCR
jgi:outer membrane lipase/esterase